MRRLTMALCVGALAVTSITAMSQDDPFGGKPAKKQVKAKPDVDPFGPEPDAKNVQVDPFGPEPDAKKDPFGPEPDVNGQGGPFGPNPFGPRPRQRKQATKQGPKQAAPASKVAPAKKSEAQRDAIARNKLDKEIPIEFVEMPLGEVMDYFAEVLDVQVYVDRRALDNSGISEDELIDINLRDIPGSMAFDLVLRQVDLTWGLREGIVIVTTPEAAEASHATRVYPIGDLAKAQPQGRSGGMGGGMADMGMGMGMEMMGGMDAGGGGEGGEGFGGGFGIGGGSGGAGITQVVARGEIGDLAKVIQSSCTPDSWQAVGGAGVVSPYRESLVITQSYRVHQQIEDLLRQLREASASRPRR